MKKLLHRILLQQQECTQRMHIFPATATTLPHCETGYLAGYVCGKTTNELLQTKQKASVTRKRWPLFPQTKRRASGPCCRTHDARKKSTFLPQLLKRCRVARQDTGLHTSAVKAHMSFYKASKKPSLHGTLGDFSRTRNEGPAGLLHKILLLQRNRWRFYPQTERRKGLLHRILLPPRAEKITFLPQRSQLLQHCRSARQDTWLHMFVEKVQVSFYKPIKKSSLHGTVGDFSRRRNEGPAAQDLAATTELLAILSADLTQGLLHRILLPHTPRAEKMHISPATVTTLPHCGTGYLAGYVCGKSTNEFLQKKQKAFFTRNR